MYELYNELNSIMFPQYLPSLSTLGIIYTSLLSTMPKDFQLSSNQDYKVANLLHQFYSLVVNLRLYMQYELVYYYI